MVLAVITYLSPMEDYFSSYMIIISYKAIFHHFNIFSFGHQYITSQLRFDRLADIVSASSFCATNINRVCTNNSPDEYVLCAINHKIHFSSIIPHWSQQPM